MRNTVNGFSKAKARQRGGERAGIKEGAGRRPDRADVQEWECEDRGRGR